MTKIVLVGIYGLIVCIAVISIMLIRQRRYASGSAIDEAQNRDFIDDISQMRRKHLDAQPWNMKYETYVAISTICAIVFAGAGYLYSNLTTGVIGGLVGYLIPEAIVFIQSSAQKQKFEERYARSLRQLSAALKSGMSLHQAIEDVCHSPFIHDDVRKEYQQLSADLKLGVSIQDAFKKFADRVKFADAQDVAIAIAMQAKVGGREGSVIEGIAHNISERIMLRKEVNSMFAGSSMTLYVLDFVPFGIVGFLVLTSNQFLSMYWESFSMFMVFIGLIGMMGIGSIITHGMVNKMKKECGVK